MKEGFQNEKVHFGVRQQTNLLRDQVAHVTRCGRTFSFKKLCPRNRACHQGSGSRDFARNADGGGIDSLGLPSVTGSIQLFPRSEESECLQDLCAGIEKLPMQLAQGVRMLDGHFGCELSTSFSGADFFASRATVHPSATLEFEEVSAVSQYNALLCNLLQYVFSLSHMRSWPCCVVCAKTTAAAPTSPASVPNFAETIGRPRLSSAKMCSRQLRWNASQYKPPAIPKPPPTTTISGSSTFTRNATLTPSASPAEVNIAVASLSPFDAARNTSSQVSASSRFSALANAKRFATAGPEANSSSTGRSFAPQWVHTVLNGLLDSVIALPFAPFNGWPSSTRQELIPVPTVTYANRRCPSPAPKVASPTAAARTSDSTCAGAIPDNLS